MAAPAHLSGSLVRVYNQFGRRDNKFKARIKILVKALGIDEFRRRVEEEWAHLKDGPQTLTEEAVSAVAAHFVDPPRREVTQDAIEAYERLRGENRAFARFVTNNVTDHKVAGYKAVTLSLKRSGHSPGDVTSEDMAAVADLADEFSYGELRVTHEQNLVLTDVPVDRMEELWQRLDELGMANPTVGTLADLICCPGGDYCSLANAKSIPVAQAIQERFENLDFLYDLGPLELNISGCMNACGHHHVAISVFSASTRRARSIIRSRLAAAGQRVLPGQDSRAFLLSRGCDGRDRQAVAGLHRRAHSRRDFPRYLSPHWPETLQGACLCLNSVP